MLTSGLAIFTSSFLIALSGALMPGPLLTATIAESSRRGFIAGPLLIGGHAILELALVVALLLGLAPLLQRPEVFAGIALIGSAILIFMAFNMFRSLPKLSLSWDAPSKRTAHPMLNGIIMSVANPYWSIWWATIGLGYILYCLQFGIWGVFFFYIGHILADLAWYSLISAAVAGGRHFFTDRFYRGLIGILATFLVGFAGYFAYAGFLKLTALG